MIGALTLPPTGIYTSPGNLSISTRYVPSSNVSYTLSSNNSWVFSGSKYFPSQFVGRTARLYFRYRNGNSGSSFQGDFGVDYIRSGNGFINNGSSNGFSTYQYNTINTVSLNSAATATGWTDIGTTESTTGGRWNLKSGSTPSSNTGPSGAVSGTYYLYAETSSPGAFNQYMWLRSDSFTIKNTYYSFYYHAYGACIGSLATYLVLED